MATKFSAALSGLKEAKTRNTPEEAPAPTPAQQPDPAPIEEKRKRGRPPGMRSNPDYEPTTILLHKDVRRDVGIILAIGDESGLNLSKLVNRLLRKYIEENEDIQGTVEIGHSILQDDPSYFHKHKKQF